MSNYDSDLVAIWPNQKPMANVVWQVNDICNFKCSYCNEGNWGAKFRNKNTDTYIKVLDKMIDHFYLLGYQDFKFFFSGGEPSLWPPLLPLLDFIKSRVKNPVLAINTNLSRPLKWWEENYHYFNDIVASFHIEFTNQDRYLENVKFLQYRTSYLALRLLMHDQRFKEVVEFSDRLKLELDNYLIEYAPLMTELMPHSDMLVYEEGWKKEFLDKHHLEEQKNVEFSRVPPPPNSYCVEHYADGSERGVNSNRIVAEDRNHFKGWKCWINDAIFISPSGDIQLASCSASRIVGNMNEGRVQFLSEPVICPEANCNCGTDIYIPKVHPKYVQKFEGEKSQEVQL